MNNYLLFIILMCFSISYMGYAIGEIFDDSYQEYQRYLTECSHVTDQNFNDFCLNYDISMRTTR